MTYSPTNAKILNSQLATSRAYSYKIHCSNMLV